MQDNRNLKGQTVYIWSIIKRYLRIGLLRRTQAQARHFAMVI